MKIINVNIVTSVSNCAIKYKSIDDVFKIEINVDLKQIIWLLIKAKIPTGYAFIPRGIHYQIFTKDSLIETNSVVQQQSIGQINL